VQEAIGEETMAVSQRVPLSLEFFPAKNAEVAAKMAGIRKDLYALQPEFCSVTFGAGGTTQEGTFGTLREMVAEGAAAASHLSCIGATKASIREQLAQLKAMGVKRIVALRGDLPSGYGNAGDFAYGSDLVRFIREETGDYFSIEVAAYPEVHPQAKSPTADLEAFVIKANAGANSALTQYFFNADAYFRFRDEVATRGVAIPIIPGIMPITNATQLMRFSDSCGAEIPRWIRMRLQSYGDDLVSIKAFGLEVVADMCERLIGGGVPTLHFYTMNQSTPVMSLCTALGLAPASKAGAPAA
jgi:methylenetetrahydrofolate reductase (NADPH)